MILSLQWHITEECNYRCKHCYHDSFLDKGPSFDEFKNIFFQFLEIKENYFWEKFTSRKITFIWWEPFVRKDFLELLRFINDNINFKLFIIIVSNGSLITQEKLDLIKSFTNLEVRFIISIEWPKDINDSIRWLWSFKKIFNAVELCKKNSFEIFLQLTLSKLNYKNVYDLVPYLKEYNISIWLRRFIPMWLWEKLWESNMLSPEEWYKFSLNNSLINYTLKRKYWIGLYLNWCSEITSYDYNWNWCPINSHQIMIVYHNLDFYPCIKLWISIWNLKNNSLSELFFSEDYIKMLDVHKTIDVCKKCSFFDFCKWWAKCITYSVNKTLSLPDPQCVRAKKIISKFF